MVGGACVKSSTCRKVVWHIHIEVWFIPFLSSNRSSYGCGQLNSAYLVLSCFIFSYLLLQNALCQKIKEHVLSLEALVDNIMYKNGVSL